MPKQEFSRRKVARRYLSGHLHRGKSTLVYWGNDFYRWNKAYWDRVPEQVMHDELLLWMLEQDITDQPAKAKEVLDCVRAFTRVHVPSVPSWLNGSKPTNVLAFRNGWAYPADLFAGRSLNEHTPDFFNTHILPFNYDPQAECPNWLEALPMWLPDKDMQLCLQEWLGYICTPDTSHCKSLFMIGKASSGKTTILRVAQQLVGPTSCSNVPLDSFLQSFETFATVGKLLNCCDEGAKMTPKLERKLKPFIEGASISMRPIYGHPVEVIPTARLMVAQNDWISGTDPTEGFWRRVILLPFQQVIPETKKKLGFWEDLTKELAGVFNWSLEGLLRLTQSKEFTRVAAGEAGIASMQRAANPLAAFVREWIEGDPSNFISGPVLENKYRAFCREHDLPHRGTLSTIKKVIQMVYPEAKTARTATARGLTNIRLTREALETD